MSTKLNAKVVANNLEAIRKSIDNAWDANDMTMQWYQLENTLVAICQAIDISQANDKLALVRETIDAFTKRGYFNSYTD